MPQNLSILIFTIASGFIVTFDSLKGPWKGACERGSPASRLPVSALPAPVPPPCPCPSRPGLSPR
jgi:hypothetical protein